ncbi:MAG: sugar transferase, partial [Desulfobacteraceae bacterium]|nr:sugar transferase [Desulfobacteraceae bacterium]
GPPELTRALAIYGSLLTILFFSYFNLYQSFRQQTIFAQLRLLFFTWGCVVISVNIIILLLANQAQLEILWPTALFDTPVYQMWAILGFLALAAARLGASTFLYFIRKKGYNSQTAAIVGTGQIALKLGSFLTKNEWMGLRLTGYFGNWGENTGPAANLPAKVMGAFEDCADFATRNNLDMVFIALPMSAAKEINKLAHTLGTSGVSVFIVPDLFTIGIHRARIHYMGDLPLMDINLFPPWKRSFDLVFSMLILLITLPLWLLIILLIKIEDWGPIFYKHTRVAESGKRFNCLKFRSMHLDADQRLAGLLERNSNLKKEWAASYKLKNDPRVTKIGQFLRRSSLDELPQFLNVIGGDMSVVGARPIVPEELDHYYQDIALTYCSMKPGITGPWQVGQRNDIVDYKDRVEQDRRYVLSCNLWQDIRIIFKTVWRVVHPRGAY